MSRVLNGSRLFPENPEVRQLLGWSGRASALSVLLMTYTEFKHITYHTPLSEKTREKIAKAYGKNYASVTLEDISIKDAHVLTDLGYTIHHKNNKIEIQLWTLHLEWLPRSYSITSIIKSNTPYWWSNSRLNGKRDVKSTSTFLENEQNNFWYPNTAGLWRSIWWRFFWWSRVSCLG